MGRAVTRGGDGRGIHSRAVAGRGTGAGPVWKQIQFKPVTSKTTNHRRYFLCQQNNYDVYLHKELIVLSDILVCCGFLCEPCPLFIYLFHHHHYFAIIILRAVVPPMKM